MKEEDFIHFLLPTTPNLLIFVSYIIILGLPGMIMFIFCSANSFPLFVCLGSVIKWVQYLLLSFSPRLDV